ncbi:class I SAM-dependent methyltransferase [Actinomarinicola tropica]|uniref:Class I SAM-dependent methyltransferase n=1 Tax=Actinomarinicola tropica TaxID=2789776 RepID=A0A5Q2RIB7_9ACTN|nr:class I SAM-dependent methyltransferase [Actinomarinicola tropica]QGG93737.1 class I SAM-dependent methyltransferase [Actinomarinicola tropica]
MGDEARDEMAALWSAMAADADAAGDVDGARLLVALAAGRVDAESPAAVEHAVAGLAPPARADALVAVARGWSLAGHERAEAFLAAALEHVPDHLEAKLTLAQVRMPGPGYYELLDRLHELIRPRTYLEIGMGDGSSMALARPGTLAVGVDPVPRLCSPVAAECRIFPERSEDFFARGDLDAVFAGRPPDLVFIDGLHTFPAVLADLAGAERIAGPDTVVVLHDLLPLDEPTQRAERAEGFYTGDVWKLLPCLAAERPDLDVLTVRTAPSGLTFVRGLTPGGTQLADRHRDLVAAFGDLPYDPATAPTGDVPADAWDEVVAFLGR